MALWVKTSLGRSPHQADDQRDVPDVAGLQQVQDVVMIIPRMLLLPLLLLFLILQERNKNLCSYPQANFSSSLATFSALPYLPGPPGRCSEEPGPCSSWQLYSG